MSVEVRVEARVDAVHPSVEGVEPCVDVREALLHHVRIASNRGSIAPNRLPIRAESASVRPPR